ncbi:MAG: hypothetical protein IKW53_05660 [Clostridia bacterium]|nr:hypothetical protein [Clostridia bacterium]
MKNLIKSRRGIAVEMAIGAMFIMIALSIILFSISGMQIEHMKSDRDAFYEKMEEYRALDVLDAVDDIKTGLGSNPNLFNDVESDSTIDINGKTYFVSSKNTENNIKYSITKGEIDLIVEVKTTEPFTDENNQTIITNTYEISKGDNIILTLEIKTTETKDENGQTTTNTITSWRD